MPAVETVYSEIEIKDLYHNHLVDAFNTAMQSRERLAIRLRLLAASMAAMTVMEEELLPLAHTVIAEELRLLADETLPECIKKHRWAG